MMSTARQAPFRRELAQVEPHAVGEEDAEERQLREPLHHRILGLEGDEFQHPWSAEKSRRQKQHRHREHAAVGELREQHGDKECDGEDEERRHEG